MAKLYLSAVPAEFGTHLQQLREALLRQQHAVQTWENLADGGPRSARERLHACLASCDVVVCLAGDRFGSQATAPASLAAPGPESPRRSLAQTEFMEARRLGKRILAFVPVSARTPRDSPNDEPEDLRRLQQEFVARELPGPGTAVARFADARELVETVLAQLAPSAATPADAPLSRTEPAAPEAGRACPYPGMRPFEEGESARFFGRRRLVEELLTQLEFQPLVLLVGNSGCGKSSLIRAGVIPAWRAKYPGGRVVRFRPGADPFVSLADSVVGFPESVTAGVRQADSQVFRHLAPAGAGSGAATAPGTAGPVLMAIDPLEDLFAGVSEPHKARSFLDALVDLARLPQSGVQLLAGLRDDYLGRLRRHDEFYRIADNSIQRMTPLAGPALREAIEAPASARGLRFEEGLPTELAGALEGLEGGMPLLQEALASWWHEEILDGGVLRRSTLLRIGGLEGALARRLDGWFAGLPPADREGVRDILLRLVDWSGLAEGAPPVPCSAAESTLIPSELRESLADQRLIVRSGVPGGSDAGVELAHEALIQAWPVFEAWAEEIRTAAAVRRQLRTDAARWSAARGRQRRDLRWKGYPLAQALEREQRGDFARVGGLGAEETRFLQACRLARTLRSLRDRAVSVAAGMVTVVSLVAALVATGRFHEARSRQHAAEIKAGLGWLARAQNAEGSTDAGFYAALATGFAGAGRSDAVSEPSAVRPLLPFLVPRVRDPFPPYLTLRDTPARKIEADRRMASAPKPFLWSAPFGPADGPVETVAYRLDGRLLASAGEEGRVRLWSAATGALERVLDASSSPVRDLDFSPAGTLLASGHADGSVVLWDVASGKKLAAFQGHGGAVRAVAFSPAGGQVASAGDDGPIKLWNVETAGETRTLAGHAGGVRGLAFGPGGVLLASGGADRSVRVWDVSRGEEVNILSGHLSAVGSVAFRPSGREVASSSPGQPVLLWDLASHKSVAKLTLPGSARSLAFSPDGAHLAVGGDDGRLRVWNLGKDLPSETFCGHSGPVCSVAFSPDGKAVVTGSEDRTLKLWAVRDAWQNPAQLAGRVSPEGGSGEAATGGADGFDWFRYVREGWVRYDEHRSELAWQQLPAGLPLAERSLPPHSWPGVLRRVHGPEQTRQLLTLALRARNWDAAVLLHGALPASGQAPVPGAAEAAAALRLQVQDDLQAGRTALAGWRMRQGDLLFGREPDWAAMRGAWLQRQGDAPGALKFFREVPSPAGWLAVARLSPDANEAVGAWRRLLAAEPGAGPALFLEAGNRAAQAGDGGAVRDLFHAGLKRHPSDRALRSGFAQGLVAVGAVDEALAQFELLAGAGSGADPGPKLAPLLVETKCLDPVLQLLGRKLVRLKATGPEAQVWECLQRLAGLHESAGRADDAVAVLKDGIAYLQGLGRDAALSAALDDLARLLTRTGRRDEALTVMRARVDLLKTQPPGAELERALLELQKSFAAAGLAGESIGVLRERVALEKSRAGRPVSGLLQELAIALQAAGKPAEALPVLEERVAALEGEKQDPVPAIRDWAAALQTAGKGPEAWAAYRRIATLPNASVTGLAEVAYWGALHGQRQEAAALFEQASARAASDGERALVTRRRGWALLAAGAFEEAFVLLGMAKAQLESDPAAAKLIDPEFRSGLCAALWLTGRKGASLDEYEALWKSQASREQWDKAEYVRGLDLPAAGRSALLELQAAWRERMHPGTQPPARP